MDSTETETVEVAEESLQSSEKKPKPRRNVTFSEKPVEAAAAPSPQSKLTNGVLSESNSSSPGKGAVPITRQPADGEENVTDVEDNVLDDGDEGNNKESQDENKAEGEEPADGPPDGGGGGTGSRRTSIDSSATTCSNNNNNWNDEMDMDVDEGEFGEEEGGEGEDGDYYDDYEYDPYSHEWVPKIKPPDSDEDSEEALLISKEQRERSLSTIAQGLMESARRNHEAYVQEQQMTKGAERELSFFDELLLCCGGCRKLCKIDDMPPHLQFNKYIHTGYRHTQDTWGCVLSVSYLHNETINILTHRKFLFWI